MTTFLNVSRVRPIFQSVKMQINWMVKDKLNLFDKIHTAWKVSKYGVISGLYFLVFGLNTEKYGPEITPYLDAFHAVSNKSFYSRNIHWLICLYIKICQKFAQFELRRAPVSVNNIFSERDKRTFVVIINDHKAVWGYLEILSLLLVIFNNVFSHEKTG